MSDDYEQAAKRAEREADRLEDESERVEDHVDDAKKAKEDMYKDPVIAEPLDEDAPETDDPAAG